MLDNKLELNMRSMIQLGGGGLKQMSKYAGQ